MARVTGLVGKDEPNTQPSAVFSPKIFETTKKWRRKRIDLQDITNVASNLENRFASENEPPVIADNIKNVNYPSSALKEPINEPVNEAVISTNNFADENCEAHTSMELTCVIELGCKSSIGGPPQEIYYKNIEFQFDTDDNDDDNEVQNVPPDAFEATHVLHDHFPSNHVETTELPDNIDEFEGYVDEGDPIYECSYCEALLWFNEQSIKDRKRSTARSHSLCCLKGKVVATEQSLYHLVSVSDLNNPNCATPSEELLVSLAGSNLYVFKFVEMRE
ncbi:hypothetical protein K1719_029017 [Acacia pycnantha]|nr:hypothetical protein K1719_029017 [Acacia pycnantha]